MPDLLAVLERERPGQYQEEVPSVPRIEALIEQVVVETVRKPRQVFVSHAHEDTELAHSLASDLEANGLGVWIAPKKLKNPSLKSRSMLSPLAVLET